MGTHQRWLGQGLHMGDSGARADAGAGVGASAGASTGIEPSHCRVYVQLSNRTNGFFCECDRCTPRQLFPYAWGVSGPGPGPGASASAGRESFRDR